MSPTMSDLELAARFVAALCALNRRRPNSFRRVDQCAERAGITKAADIERALATAERAGFITVRVDGVCAMLTDKGLEAAAKSS